MTEKEILYQVIAREVSNTLGMINPSLKMFSNLATNYIIKFIDPYVDAFCNLELGKFNANAAAEFTKEQVNDKVNDFLKKYKTEAEYREGL